LTFFLSLTGCFHDLGGRDRSDRSEDETEAGEDPDGGEDPAGGALADGGGPRGRDGGLDAAPETGVESAEAGEDAEPRDAAGQVDGSAQPDATVPRNPACQGGKPETGAVWLEEGFESFPLGTLGTQPPWVRSMEAKSNAVTDSWTHAGSRAFLLSSFTTSSELLYIALPGEQIPARLTIELWLAPDGSYVQHDFAAWGLAWTSSKFTLDLRFSVRVADHALYYSDDPRPFVATSAPTGTQLFNEIEYARRSAMNSTALYNYVRLELDLCEDRLTTYASLDGSAIKRSEVALSPLQRFNAFVLVGGVNETFFDDIRVTAEGAGL
jgi:hypothetical protein